MGFFSDLNNTTFTEDDPTVIINPLEAVEGQMEEGVEEGVEEETKSIDEESQTSSVKENLSPFQESLSKNESKMAHPDVETVLNQMEQATDVQDNSKNIPSTKEEATEQDMPIESMMPIFPSGSISRAKS